MARTRQCSATPATGQVSCEPTAEAGDLRFGVRRVKEAGRIYEVTLPDATFGLTPQALEKGVRFNLLVNDNDGRGRKGWLEIAPGLGRNFEPKAFPLLVLEQKEGQGK